MSLHASLAKVGLITAGLSLVGAGCFSQPSAPAANAPTGQPSTQTGARRYQSCADRHATDGEIWGTDEQGWRPGDRLDIPADFPAPAQTDLCGAIGKLNTVYFVSRLSAEELAGFYDAALQAQGYATSRTGGFGKDLVVDFSRSDARGNVYIDAVEATHAVRYRLVTP